MNQQNLKLAESIICKLLLKPTTHAEWCANLNKKHEVIRLIENNGKRSTV